MTGTSTLPTVDAVGPKDPEEVEVVSFDFTTAVATAGAVIQTARIEIDLLDGVDPNPTAIVSGPYSIDVGGLIVRQKFSGGLHGVTYGLRCLGDDSAGLTHLVAATMLVFHQA